MAVELTSYLTAVLNKNPDLRRMLGELSDEELEEMLLEVGRQLEEEASPSELSKGFFVEVRSIIGEDEWQTCQQHVEQWFHSRSELRLGEEDTEVLTARLVWYSLIITEYDHRHTD